MYVTSAKINTAEGAMAWDSVRDKEPIDLNTMDIDMRHAKLNRRKMKKASGVRFKFVMK